MNLPVHDKRDQLEKIAAGILTGEQIIAVYDGAGTGTGFIGLTNRRMILQDNSTFGKKVALTSVPYSRINAVSYVADRNMLGFTSSSTIAVSAGGQMYEISFRGAEKAKHAHDVILWHATQG